MAPASAEFRPHFEAYTSNVLRDLLGISPEGIAALGQSL